MVAQSSINKTEVKVALNLHGINFIDNLRMCAWLLNPLKFRVVCKRFYMFANGIVLYLHALVKNYKK